VFAHHDAIRTETATQNVRALTFSNIKRNAVFEKATFSPKVPTLGAPPSAEDLRNFDQRKNSIEDFDVYYIFRETPGTTE
jgi:hypothetical protein